LGIELWRVNAVDEFGHVTAEQLGNGIATSRTYDNVRGMLTGMQSSLGANTLQDFSYDYDAIGNMLFLHDSIVGYKESFEYDALGRVRKVFDLAGVQTHRYDYDAIGNITFKTGVGVYAYDPNHPHAVQSAGGNTYSYDANGNQTAGAGRAIGWTSFNKPALITTANGSSEFGYDAGHNRIWKRAPTSAGFETTRYVGKIFEQRELNGVIKDIVHVYAGSSLIATIESAAGLTNTRYMHADHLGSVNLITDENGAVVERLRFDVFGAPVDPHTGVAKADFGTSTTTRGYTGHEMDASTGLINMNARLYDPVLGRFISADTVVPEPGNMQAFNRYSYVLNNPLIYTDPTGHWSWKNFGKVLGQVAIIAVAAVAAYYGGAYFLSMYANAAGVAAAGSFVAAGGSSMSVGYLAAYGGAYAAASSSVIGGVIAGAAGGAIFGVTATALSGGNVSQILRAGLNGAIGGAVAGGVASGLSGVGVSPFFARPISAGTSSLAQGGNKDSALMSMGLAITGLTVSKLYQNIVNYEIDPNSGGNAVDKGNMTMPFKGVNNIGTAGKVDPNSIFGEGGYVSRFINQIPGVNAVAGMHDVFQVRLEELGDGMARNIFNVPGMAVAAAITYPGILDLNPSLSAVVADHIRH